MNLWFEAIDEGDHEQIKIMIEDFGDDDKLEFYGIKSSKDVEELSKYLVDSSYAKGGGVEERIYEVEYWETEEDRDMGEGNMYMLSEEEEVSKDKSIQRARNLFNKQKFCSSRSFR